MPKRYTFIVIDSSGRPLKKASLSAKFILSASLTIIALLTSVFVFGFDYQKMRKAGRRAEVLQSEVTSQADEIRGQRRQIQSFASKINELKEHIVRLDELEKQVRLLANIEPETNEDGAYGIGGSIPEDLDPNLDLAREHDRLIRNMHEQVAQLQTASIHKEKELKVLLEKLEEQRNLLSATPSIQPTRGTITSRFGYRKSPFASGRSELHKGVDIANRKGTPVVATADGVVKFAGMRGLFGRVITIDHGHGIFTYYAHLSKALKKEGDKVKRGEIIGKMGNTGRSTGPHLHYEVRLNGIPVNPLKYFNK